MAIRPYCAVLRSVAHGVAAGLQCWVGVPGIGRGTAGLTAGPPEAWLTLITERGHMPRRPNSTTSAGTSNERTAIASMSTPMAMAPAAHSPELAHSPKTPVRGPVVGY